MCGGVHERWVVSELDTQCSNRRAAASARRACLVLSCLGFLGSRSRSRVGVEGIADPNWTERAFDVKQALIAPTAPAKAVACIL